MVQYFYATSTLVSILFFQLVLFRDHSYIDDSIKEVVEMLSFELKKIRSLFTKMLK